MVGVYRNTEDTSGAIVTLDAVINRITTGAKGLDEKTRYCNIISHTDKKAYDAYRAKNLPAVIFAGTFPQEKGKRKAQYLLQHSGHIVLDIDGLTAEQMPDLLSDFAQHPYIRLAFISPSGRGIKAVVKVDPVPNNDLEHKGAWQACVDFFEDLATEHGFEVDPTGKDCSRLCFLSHDAQAIIHEDVPAIEWDRDEWIAAEEAKQARFEADAKIAYTGAVDVQALDYIDPNGLIYNDWLSVITACKHAGLTIAQTDQWCRRGGVRYTKGEVEIRWNTLHLEVSWGAVVNLAKSNGYKPPARPKRYAIDTQHEHVTSDIDTERNNNQNAVTRWLQDTEEKKGKQLLILGSAAGTGKTTATVTTAETLLYIAKTTDEADEVFAELDRQEQDVIRHRPRMFNRYHKDIDGNDDWHTLPLGLGEHDRPCIEPEACNLHVELQETPNAICSRCPLLEKCKENAYLSQADKERNTSKVVYAWSEVIACDKMFKGRVKRICTKDDILIVDEVNPLSLTQARKLDRDMLFDLTERFRQLHEETASIFMRLKALLDLISTAETPEAFIEGVKQWVEDTENLTEMDKTLEKYPLGYVIVETPETAEHNQPFSALLEYQGQSVTVPVVDANTADTTPAFYVSPDKLIETEKYQVRFVGYSYLLMVGLATLETPPRRHRHLLRDIKTFIHENTDLATAPFTFDAKAQCFDFHLKPTLNHRRVIFNTASDPDNLIGEAYRETDVTIARAEGAPPAWKTDLVFQVSSGNYLPRHSLIKYGEDQAKQFKARAQALIDSYIVPSIKAGLKVLVVAPKAFQEVERVKQWAVTDPDDYIEGQTAILINHHRAEGRNDYQDCDIAFIFHYEPEHHALQAHSKHIYRNAEPSLSFERTEQEITAGGVRFKKQAYTDERVQNLYHRECRSRLMQSAMRLRPNIHEGKIVVFLTAEPIDIPITPTPFTPADAAHFTGDWVAFKEKLNIVATAAEQGDVQAIMETTGVSERTARRKTKSARDQLKAVRDAEILRLHSEGHSQREIERLLKDTPHKASRKVISKVIEVVQNGQPVIRAPYSDLSEMHHPSENVEDITVSDEPVTQTCDTSVTTGELEALGFEPKTIRLQSVETGEVISVKALSRPQPRRGITREDKHARKEAIVNDITALYHDGEPPSEIASFLGIPEGFVDAVIGTLDF